MSTSRNYPRISARRPCRSTTRVVATYRRSYVDSEDDRVNGNTYQTGLAAVARRLSEVSTMTTYSSTPASSQEDSATRSHLVKGHRPWARSRERRLGLSRLLAQGLEISRSALPHGTQRARLERDIAQLLNAHSVLIRESPEALRVREVREQLRCRHSSAATWIVRPGGSRSQVPDACP